MDHNNSHSQNKGVTNTNTNNDFEIDADLMAAVNSIVDEQEANENPGSNFVSSSVPFAPRDTTEINDLKTTIAQMQTQIEMLSRLLDQRALGSHTQTPRSPQPEMNSGSEIIEGVFDGQKMIAEDGRSFPVPPNYASKSKLVEGDMMKLTITPSGSFVYKQIGPTERKRLRGELLYDPESGKWSVLSDGRTYKVLTASVTFYKGQPGGQVTILVPQNGESEWGAIENLIVS